MSFPSMLQLRYKMPGKFFYVLLENLPLFWHVYVFIAPNLQDLRLVRDKFTHVSRGFAFVHFHSVNSFVIGDWIS